MCETVPPPSIFFWLSFFCSIYKASSLSLLLIAQHWSTNALVASQICLIEELNLKITHFCKWFPLAFMSFYLLTLRFPICVLIFSRNFSVLLGIVRLVLWVFGIVWWDLGNRCWIAFINVLDEIWCSWKGIWNSVCNLVWLDCSLDGQFIIVPNGVSKFNALDVLHLQCAIWVLHAICLRSTTYAK